MPDIVWTDYLRYRAELRGYDLEVIAQLLSHATERYFDIETQRSVVVGKHRDQLVMIPCDVEGDIVTPVTIHAVTKQQIRFRVRSGRFQVYE